VFALPLHVFPEAGKWELCPIGQFPLPVGQYEGKKHLLLCDAQNVRL